MVEKNGEREFFILDECLGVPSTARAHRDYWDCGVDEVLGSVANLTGPLAASQSAEMTQEEKDGGPLRP